MSKNIIIQEGGLGKQLTADKLKTTLVGGGSCLWVPEDETTLGTKTITENGTYRASDDGYYGYSEVTVSGIGSVTGRDPEIDEDVTVTKDPETGDLVKTITPESIRIITPPTKTSYADKETINFSGIVVHAYSSKGTDLGVVPFNELVFPVTQASKDEASSDEWSDGHGINALQISYTPHWNKYWDYVHQRPDPSRDYQVFLSKVLGEINGNPAMWGNESGPTQFFVTEYDGSFYIWGSTADRRLNEYEDTGREYDRYSMVGGTSESSGTGEMQKHSKSSWITGIPSSTVEPSGTPQVEPVASEQTIPVQWQGLETTFDITVT